MMKCKLRVVEPLVPCIIHIPHISKTHAMSANPQVKGSNPSTNLIFFNFQILLFKVPVFLSLRKLVFVTELKVVRCISSLKNPCFYLCKRNNSKFCKNVTNLLSKNSNFSKKNLKNGILFEKGNSKSK